ncbi:MAG: hypothetical protein ACK52S_14445 [Pirellula sp.]
MGKSTVDEDLRARRSPWKKIAVEETAMGETPRGRFRWCDTLTATNIARRPSRNGAIAQQLIQRC